MDNNEVTKVFARLGSFLELLHSNVLTRNELCQILATTLVPPRTVDVAIYEVSQLKTFRLTGIYGGDIPPNLLAMKFPLNTDFPVGAAILNREIVWMEDFHQLKQEFPLALNEVEAETHASFISVPVFYRLKIVGCITITGQMRPPDSLSIAILELIALMVAPQLVNNVLDISRSTEGKIGLKDSELSVRELLVQEMMSQGKRNIEIAKQLGYSESMIRQIAVSLFAKLNVHSRQDAGDLFDNKQIF